MASKRIKYREKWTAWRSNVRVAAARFSEVNGRWWYEYDRLWNARLGGDPDWTISGRLGEYRKRCKACYWFCRVVLDPAFRFFRGDKAHCKDTYEWHLVEHGTADERVIK